MENTFERKKPAQLDFKYSLPLTTATRSIQSSSLAQIPPLGCNQPEEQSCQIKSGCFTPKFHMEDTQQAYRMEPPADNDYSMQVSELNDETEYDQRMNNARGEID